MAGGQGERLWPLSTPTRPKQFLPLLSGHSLLRATLERVAPLVAKHDLFVVAPRCYYDLIMEELTLPSTRVILEPEGRNTAPALALATVVLTKRDPQGVMIVLPADHFIGKVEQFQKLLKVGVKAARRYKCLVTLGVKPVHPATGYGYIRCGELVGSIEDIPLYKVEKFIEKPDRARAEALVAEGCWLWNTGIFVWRMDVFQQALARHVPDLYAGILELEAHLESPNWESVLSQVYSRLKAISIDYALMEKAENLLVVPADVDWSDLGDWVSFATLFPKDTAHNAVHARHLAMETSGCIIYAEDPQRLIATLGVQDLIVVETKAALLIVPKMRAQEIKQLLEKFYFQQRFKK